MSAVAFGVARQALDSLGKLVLRINYF
jgi:hypothetical protein